MDKEEFIEYLDNLIVALEALKEQLEDDVPPSKADAVFTIDENPLVEYLDGVIDW